MLITFRSKAHADITMFGEVALRLLKMMGHSGTVPGALLPEDIPAAVARLEAALAQLAPSDGAARDDEDEEPVVSLAQRAGPLLPLHMR
ncbi:MAG TPA: DUF1840 domain-containing protein [Gammaproteobacteria bacterium]